METTEHIVESYVRFVKKWFTISNIKAKGGKEIDLLAIDKDGNRYHIESGVTHLKSWGLISKPSKDDFITVKKKTKEVTQWRRRNSVDFFRKEKFGNSKVLEKLREFGFSGNKYKKIIVTWGVAEPDVHEYAKKHGIEVWELKNKLKELIDEIGLTYYSDDILRTLQLVKISRTMQVKSKINGILEKIEDKKLKREIRKELKDLT